MKYILESLPPPPPSFHEKKPKVPPPPGQKSQKTKEIDNTEEKKQEAKIWFLEKYQKLTPTQKIKTKQQLLTAYDKLKFGGRIILNSKEFVHIKTFLEKYGQTLDSKSFEELLREILGIGKKSKILENISRVILEAHGFRPHFGPDDTMHIALSLFNIDEFKNASPQTKPDIYKELALKEGSPIYLMTHMSITEPITEDLLEKEYTTQLQRIKSTKKKNYFINKKWKNHLLILFYSEVINWALNPARTTPLIDDTAYRYIKDKVGAGNISEQNSRIKKILEQLNEYGDPISKDTIRDPIEKWQKGEYGHGLMEKATIELGDSVDKIVENIKEETPNMEEHDIAKILKDTSTIIGNMSEDEAQKYITTKFESAGQDTTNEKLYNKLRDAIKVLKYSSEEFTKPGETSGEEELTKPEEEEKKDTPKEPTEETNDWGKEWGKEWQETPEINDQNNIELNLMGIISDASNIGALRGNLLKYFYENSIDPDYLQKGEIPEKLAEWFRDKYSTEDLIKKLSGADKIEGFKSRPARESIARLAKLFANNFIETAKKKLEAEGNA